MNMLSLVILRVLKFMLNEKIDILFRRECEDMIDELKGKFNGMSIEINKKKELQVLEAGWWNDLFLESLLFLNFLLVYCYTLPVLPTLELEDSLIMGNEELSTIPKKESDEFIKSSVEDLVLIPSESEDTSGSDSECILPSCDDFSPINVYEEKFVTFSNPLFNSNDDFTSGDDESLFDEDVPEDNVKIYSNPLFEFDDEYISNDVNPLFDEVLEDIECKVSYDSNLDESTFLVTPLSDSNEDECFTPSDNVELLLHHDLWCYDDDDGSGGATVVVVAAWSGEAVGGLWCGQCREEGEEKKERGGEWGSGLGRSEEEEHIWCSPEKSAGKVSGRGQAERGGDVDAFLDIDIPTNIKDGFYDSEGDVLYHESLLSNDTILSLPPEVFLDHNPRSLSDINDYGKSF
ncbi:hypothetical protein Tco_0438024 [Tanacetum coccineum]